MHLHTDHIMFPSGSVLTYMPLPAMNTTVTHNTHPNHIHRSVCVCACVCTVCAELSLTQRYDHESGWDPKSQRITLLLSVDATLLSCTHGGEPLVMEGVGQNYNGNVCVFACTSENRCNDCGKKTSCVDAQIKH